MKPWIYFKADLLQGGFNSNIFGKIVLYDPADLVKWGKGLKIEKILGARTFYGLQSQEMSCEPGWMDKMFNIEMMVADIEPYRSISLFHHVLLKKSE